MVVYDPDYHKPTRSECAMKALSGFTMGFFGGGGIGFLIGFMMASQGGTRGFRVISSSLKMALRSGIVFGCFLALGGAIRCDDRINEKVNGKNIQKQYEELRNRYEVSYPKKY